MWKRMACEVGVYFPSTSARGFCTRQAITRGACWGPARSLQAAEYLSKAGYNTLAWVNGGLDTARVEDLPVVGADDLR